MLNRRAVSACAAALLSVAGIARAQSFYESFESGIPSTWIIHNQSEPVGGTDWYTLTSFATVPPHGGKQGAYANYNSGSDTSTSSDWLILDTVTLRNGDVFSFWTATNAAHNYPDRLQVRMSTSGGSANTGSNELDVGDFSTLLLDINENYGSTDYPGTASQYSVTITGLPAEGVPGRIAFRYFIEKGGPLGPNSDLIMIDDVSYVSAADASGACCLEDGTCSILTESLCTPGGGTYKGNGTACAGAGCQPIVGACCLPNGTCATKSPSGCASASGIFRGKNLECAIVQCAQPWVEVGDAGDLPGTAQVVAGAGSLSAIKGHIDSADADMYRIRICDYTHFNASTLADVNNDSQLFLFDSSGKGLVMDDGNELDLAGTTLTQKYVAANGEYFIAYTLYNRDPIDSTGVFIWKDANSEGNYFPEWAPNGSGAANPVQGWMGTPQGGLDYTIVLTGACFIGATCYANCDNSTTAPILNANDFQCFLNAYAAGCT